MLVARCAATLGLLVVLVGGAGGCDCSGVKCGALANGVTNIVLSCGTTESPAVRITGPCSVLGPATAQSVAVTSNTAGTCHVELTFGTGFTYSTDVTFVSSTQTGCCPGTNVSPTQTTFTVNSPSTTCVDAVADAPSDAQADAGADG
jgi:hypothetical protein